jgi:PAS domain S-box-containing protein
MKERVMKTENKIIASSIFLGMSFWIIDALIDSFIFYEATFLESLIFDLPKIEIYFRLVILISFSIFGFIVSRFFTKQRQIEDVLRESEEKYRTLIENAGEAIIVAQDGVIKFANPKGEELYGRSQEELASRPLTYFIHEEDREMVGERHKRRLKGEEPPVAYSFRIVDKNGNIKWVELSVVLFSWDDRPATLCFMTDITEKMTIEAQLQQAQKLEALGILAGGLAHDFNNLLTVIVGNIDLAKDDIKPDVGISENLTEAEKASLRAKELTKQLITFSKGGEPVKEVGSIGDLVKDTTNLTISGSNARCEFSLPENLWLAKFDEGQMKHAIKNLIDNAIESIQDGGSIDIQTENFEIDSETAESSSPFSEGKYIKIAIRDHGVGIPEDHLSKIFDPYFSTKEMGKQKGMGLGLATTYSIINRHEGHLIVESEVGVGTTFTIYLPVAVEDIVDLEPIEIPKPEKPEIHTGRILLMDDEKSIRKVTKQMLSRLGYDPDFAKDGTEAIELYKGAIESGKPFEAVILDLTIKEGMGGVDTIKRLIEIDPQIRAIVSSGYSNDPVMTNFRAYGFIGALPKPYPMKDLSDALNKVTEE